MQMALTQMIGRLSRNDVKLIGRDSFLLYMVVMGLMIAVISRFVMPWLDGVLADNNFMPGETIKVRLADCYPVVVSFFGVYNGAMLIGFLFGFVLIDEKDDRTLQAIMVSPVSLERYALYRVGVPVLLAAVLVPAEVLIMNLHPIPPFWQLLPICIGGALMAPIMSMFLALMASDKVQGMAMGKFGAIAGWTIVIGWFVDGPLQYAFGIFPPWWIHKAYWLAADGSGWWWLPLIIGIIYQLLLIQYLVRRFTEKAYEG